MKRVGKAARLAGLLSVSLGVCALSGVALADVKFEGAGTSRRAKQDEMHYKPFHADLWAKCSDWSDGQGVSPELTNGKPVLILAWSGWYRAGDSAARIAQSMNDQFASKGLVVVGVHNTKGFDQAKTNAERLGLKFPYANDATGGFREGLMLDQDPDFVVIDRAGNARFVDIETGSVEEAVREVVNETAEAAAGKLAGLSDAAAKAARDAKKTRDVTGVLAPGQTIAVEFELPEKEVYEGVKWPYRVKGEGRYEFDKLSDKLIHEPPSMTIPEEPENYKPFAPLTKGKLAVLYFIDPKVRGSLNILPTMNTLQELYKRDAVMIGVTAKFGIEAFGMSAEDAAKLVERNGPLVDEILRTRPMNHAMMLNINGLTISKLREISLFGNNMDDAAVCVILSTDYTIRWIGHPAEDGFKTQMNALIKVDPGVKARRTAEDAKLKSGT